MGRTSKPVATNRKHLTAAEKEQREHYEQSLLSGKKITERKRVRADAVAHGEFRRVVALMRAIGKDDALYSEQIKAAADRGDRGLQNAVELLFDCGFTGVSEARGERCSKAALAE